MSKQSEIYSEHHANLAGMTLATLGLVDWSEKSVKALQEAAKAQGLDIDVDGWLGDETIAVLRSGKKPISPPAVHTAQPGELILDGEGITPPAGLKVVNFLQQGGLRAGAKNVGPRLKEYGGAKGVTQFVLHRGSTVVLDDARHTFRVLEARGFSTTFILGMDGTLYQTFDPAVHRGRHATWHNDASDALDVSGPLFTIENGQPKPGAPGQEPWSFKISEGKKGDNLPPLARKSRTVRQWSPTPAQQKALVAFVPWWCELRGIPLTACEDYRCYRLGGLGAKDPVTNVTGILAHMQIAGPGERVDGVVELECLKRAKDSAAVADGPGSQNRSFIAWTKTFDL
jgi:hypothetical protein